MKVASLLLFLVSSSWAGHNPPGTNQRPILHPQESVYFTKEKYLQGWIPPAPVLTHADYVVDGGQYKTIQSAVNAAIKAGGTARKYIKLKAGSYKETVYIPYTNVPLTIFGDGKSASDTVIVQKLGAQTSIGEYKNVVERYIKPGDPAYKMYHDCADNKKQVGTACSAIFWVQAPNVQIIRLTIQNAHSTKGDSQAVALSIESDKVQVHDARLLSRQDTLYSGGNGNYVQRILITETYIEGDVDFVFGGGSAVFEHCSFRVKSDRHDDSGIVFAPSTHPNKQYGFLVCQSKIEGDSHWYSHKKVSLARAWDAGVSSASAYKPGISPNGQLVIRDTNIAAIVPSNAPYESATSGRKYSGNGASSRDLNNNKYNRFWEFNNNGDGA